MSDGNCCSGGWPWIVAIIIVIIILILLWLWVWPTSPSQKISSNSSYNNILEVTVVEKTNDHINFGKGSNLGYAINGEQGKFLKLQDGKTYRFVVKTKGHPFYITTSSKGGNDAIGAINEPREPSESTSFPFIASKDLPQPLYYQCSIHKYMGSQILIE